MIEQYALIDYVRSLENRANGRRFEIIVSALKNLRIEPHIQRFRHVNVRNIIVDFSPGNKAQRLLFSAHYDSIRGSPAANDNASGVAVLLGLCRNLKNSRLPVRVVFFDREEAWLRTPLLKLGLLGSLSYVATTRIKSIKAVYNVEACGRGDLLGIWPVTRQEVQLPAVQYVLAAAESLGIPCRTAHLPWLLFSSDHLSFRLRGLHNAITLSLLPQSQLPAFDALMNNMSLVKLLAGRRPRLPDPLSSIHTSRDTSSHLSQKSLELMLSVLMELVRRETGWEFSTGKIINRQTKQQEVYNR